ncbi:hypothetical protein Ade02nite_15930 [Paractinoplanes deccanensis]|uniref:ROK family transcriptional regulator n=1 Tax=Paractinoplanes deccanensis TaxID=113561 RepID=A0ABQ3XZ59_9ACTN|nr:ROK family protein [Actinoplanes deccanensis]GID72952.1 hypothetical protein Ade02nite_15930 [Actinoplanes deccanensis]
MEIVRSVTDEHVLRTLMRHRRLTRAELAAEIGISKPTAGESVRRLTERGLVTDTGERTPGGRGKGRVGSYYALSPSVGAAMAITIAPEGVVAECVDVYGDTIAQAVRPAYPTEIAAAVTSAAGEAIARAGQPVRVAVVGAADPVDRATGRLVHLPDAPFLVGDLDPAALLRPYVTGPVIVDNDVNWAALAERDHQATHGQPEHTSRRPEHTSPQLDLASRARLGLAPPEHSRQWRDPAERAEPGQGRRGGGDFAYLYLGEGLGCAMVSDGEVRRGHSGLAGEIAHLITAGAGGRAVRFIEVFGELGLRQKRRGSHAGSETAIDVRRLLASDPATREILARAVAGVIAAVVALADPREVVLGGPWGPALADDIRAAAERMPRHVPVRPASVTREPVLTAVRAEALNRLRTLVTAAG